MAETIKGIQAQGIHHKQHQSSGMVEELAAKARIEAKK